MSDNHKDPISNDVKENSTVDSYIKETAVLLKLMESDNTIGESFIKGYFPKKMCNRLKELVILERWEDISLLLSAFVSLSDGCVSKDIILPLKTILNTSSIKVESLRCLKDICDCIFLSCEKNSQWFADDQPDRIGLILLSLYKRLKLFLDNSNGSLNYYCVICLRSIIDLMNLWICHTEGKYKHLLIHDAKLTNELIQLTFDPIDYLLLLSSSEFLNLLNKLDDNDNNVNILAKIKCFDMSEYHNEIKNFKENLIKLIMSSQISEFNANLEAIISKSFNLSSGKNLICGIKAKLNLTSLKKSSNFTIDNDGNLCLGKFTTFFATKSEGSKRIALECNYSSMVAPFVEKSDDSVMQFKFIVQDAFILAMWEGIEDHKNGVIVTLELSGINTNEIFDFIIECLDNRREDDFRYDTKSIISGHCVTPKFKENEAIGDELNTLEEPPAPRKSLNTNCIDELEKRKTVKFADNSQKLYLPLFGKETKSPRYDSDIDRTPAAVSSRNFYIKNCNFKKRLVHSLPGSSIEEFSSIKKKQRLSTSTQYSSRSSLSTNEASFFDDDDGYSNMEIEQNSNDKFLRWKQKIKRDSFSEKSINHAKMIIQQVESTRTGLISNLNSQINVLLSDLLNNLTNSTMNESTDQSFNLTNNESIN